MKEKEIDDTPTPKRATRLRTSGDCRRLLAKIINQQVKGDIPDGQAKSTAYLISILLRAIEQDCTETRLEEVEKQIEEINAREL